MMADRKRVINAIEQAKKQSEEYALDKIIVPFKEADMILTLLKEQEPKTILGIADSIEGIEVGKCPRCERMILSKQSDPTWFCKYCGQAVKWG